MTTTPKPFAPVFVPNAGDQWTDVEHSVWRLRGQEYSWREIEAIINTRNDLDVHGDEIQFVLSRDDEGFVDWQVLMYRYEAQLRNLPEMEDTLARRREIMLRNDARRSRLARIIRTPKVPVEAVLAAERELGRIDEREARLLGLNAPTRLRVEVEPPVLADVEEKILLLAAASEAADGVIEATATPVKKKSTKRKKAS